MLSFKEGVQFAGLDRKILQACEIAEAIYRAHGKDCTVTSGTEGKHRALKSKHYCGHAVDLRIRDLLPGVAQTIATDLALRLPGFNVLLETDHIHVEWDPAYEGPGQP